MNGRFEPAASRADDFERRRMERYLRGTLEGPRHGRGVLRWPQAFAEAALTLIRFFRVSDGLETRAIWKECSDVTRACASWLRYNDDRPQPRAGRR